MSGTDPGQTERRLTQGAHGLADKAEQRHAMHVQVKQIHVTETSTDGAVRVTVDSSGSLTDLVLTDKIRGMPPSEVAAQVMACLRHAQLQLAPLVQETMLTVVGGEEAAHPRGAS